MRHAADEPLRAPAVVAGGSGKSADRGCRGRPFMHWGRQGFRFIRRHPGASAGVLLGIYVATKLVREPGARALLRLLGINAVGSLHSLWTLLHVDTQGTVESVGLTAGKLLIATLPLLVLARRWHGWERLLVFFWLPILYPFWLLAGASHAILLAGLSALTLWLVRFRWLRWTAILPLVALGAPVRIHQFDSAWSRAALVQRCDSNSGRRPINLRPEQICPGYAGVSPLRPDEVLLAGSVPETSDPGAPMLGGSWWLRRSAGGWEFDGPSKVNFSFWPGCAVGDELWLARPNVMMSVRRDPATGVESVRKFPVPGTHMDLGEVVCLPDENLVFITEALTGSGIWQVTPRTGEVRRLAQEVGGLGAQGRRGPDGRLIFANGTDLVIYSHEREEVIERTVASVQMFGGLDVCALNAEAGVADILGRLRFFRPDTAGHYRFVGGVSLRAPRELAYSPDCQYVAVTSFDDESVYLIDRSALRKIATYRVGPALRGVTFLGPREFAVADACTMTYFNF
jgi:hypothetical protein